MTYTVEERRVTLLVAARRTVKGWNVAMVVPIVLQSPDHWAAVEAFATDVLKTKRLEQAE